MNSPRSAGRSKYLLVLDVMDEVDEVDEVEDYDKEASPVNELGPGK